MISDDHRPWPAPKAPWLLRQVWQRVLMAHWPVAEDQVRAALPPALRPFLDTYQGKAWVGIVGFRATGTRLRVLPPLPGLSSFVELNVRTYLSIDRKPGVYFFSLDTVHVLACAGARLIYDLPYFPASTQLRSHGGIEHLRSVRWGPGRASFVASYHPAGQPVPANSDPFTSFLAERYCLYTADRGGRVRRGEIHHRPWMLSRAQASIRMNTMLVPMGLPTPAEPPVCHFAEEQEAFIWLPVTVDYLTSSSKGVGATTRMEREGVFSTRFLASVTAI